MKETTKRALLLSSKSFTFMTYVMICLIVAAAFFWQYQITASQLQQHQQQQDTQHKQTINMLNKVTSAQIGSLQKQLILVAQRPVLSAVLVSGDDVQLANQQRALHEIFASAKSICLIGAEVDNVDKNACIPITYATLESLRQAKKEGRSSIALLQPGTEDAHLLLAQRITDQDNNVVGVLVLTFSPDIVTKLLFTDEHVDGYAELLQGTKNNIALATQGNMILKQGVAPFQVEIAGTHWHIAYWPEKISAITQSFTLIIVIFGVIILMWLLLVAIRGYVHKVDIANLKQQLLDLNSGTMKTKYPIINRSLQEISANIQVLARTKRVVTESNTQPKKPLNSPSTNTKTTSEIIRKKSQENTIVDPDELDMLEDNVDIVQSIFKAYDIRGIVGESLNSEIVRVIGRAIGSEAQALGQKHLVVGRDGRHSSPELSEALIAGILGSGCDVTDLGMVPTPVLYFASHHLGTQSAVMVTGSHNPGNYNGLKIILAGKSLTGDAIQGLYRRIDQSELLKGQGTRHQANVTEDYIQKIADDIQVSRPIKVVVDCGNGVAGAIVPLLLRALGCEVIELYCEVDGSFPNHHPDPSQPDNLQDLAAAVKQHDAELGIAFDGDGDRLGVVDTMGNTIYPDRLMMMFAQDVLLRRPGAVIIYDVKSSNLLGEEISRAGGEAIMWQSGHSVIKNKMLEMNAQLAGELSGHIFFKERWYGFDDGMYAAARLLELLCQDPLERTPTEIFAALPSRKSTPEILLAMDAVASKQFIAKIQQEGNFPDAQVTTIDGLRADYVNGWGLVRASNTMPGLTLRFEGDTEADLSYIQERFKRQMFNINPTLNISFSDKVSPLSYDESSVLSSDKPISSSLDEPVSLSLEESTSLSFDEPVALSLEESISSVPEQSLSLAPEKKPGLTLKDTE
jgi:phosphomannomutase/phosphoglucomutase